LGIRLLHQLEELLRLFLAVSPVQPCSEVLGWNTKYSRLVFAASSGTAVNASVIDLGTAFV